ncbi:MAG: DUF3473 domain-containing protein [Crenarchaeota archaeon]|nr:MAG: DUF3473 domain-containing protein [Thermoproteota archaeon]RDJ33328.1 MAG: DUF3473 domain-containing protein [Thermoproteota archaeon]RDJ36169.1 MAG: DUF3473 domain-containing protein [Thermoproteota archaeon]RDJ38800.1 MAG: DUF3473 domain-containing protein [Thermoproteota archaeon]
MNILGIDFEDWYHPELIQPVINSRKKVPKVINGIDKILELLRRCNTFATFFVVGELLEYKIEILDKILENGHEIAFHTMHHTRIDSENFKEKFYDELKVFSDLTNKKSKGFRAPTFSLNEKSSWVIDALNEFNYEYDSSIVPVKTSMYGIPDADYKPYKISSSSIEKNDPNGKIMEFPLLTTKLLGKKIPAAGGFYLRILPKIITKNAIKNAENEEIPATFYIHSWELTPEYMPKIKLNMKDHFVTYHNLEKTPRRMEEILKTFSFTSFERFIQKM